MNQIIKEGVNQKNTNNMNLLSYMQKISQIKKNKKRYIVHFFKYKKCKINPAHIMHGCVFGEGFFSKNGALIIEHPLQAKKKGFFFFYSIFALKKRLSLFFVNRKGSTFFFTI